MPRVLETNNNGDLSFKEFVWDDDEEDISYPIQSVVELDRVDGVKQTDARRDPDWLTYKTTELGVNSSLERWEEEVEVIIRNAENNLEIAEYTFLIIATDGKEESKRFVTLRVV